MPRKKKKKTWQKPKINDELCTACGEMIDMNLDGWAVNGKGQIVHYGAFSKQKGKCFEQLMPKKTKLESFTTINRGL